ncbi:MAG: AraC family transcriptional regulator [Chitinophagaceae bacterium]
MNEIIKLNKGNYSGEVQNLKEYAGFITSKTTYIDNYNTEFHYHENPHLSFILQGGNYEHKKSQTSIKTFGDVLFYHSGEIHKTIPTNETSKNLNLEFDINFLKDNFVSETELKNVVDHNLNSRLFMLKVHSELQLNDTITETAIQALLLNFVKNNKTDNRKTIRWIVELTNILNDEWNRNHSLSELSQRLGIHPVTISKNFNKYFGCTYGDYVRKLRIDRSLALIKSTHSSLTEIAFLCGFADQSHFIRTFKSYTGTNPKYFQKL